MAPGFQTAKVISNKNLAGNFYQLICQSGSPLIFIPGQYLIVKINEERVTQYSIASLPNENTFELLIDVSPDGVSSRYIKNLKAGDELTYMKPMGKFILEEITDQIIFLATGSGIAPFKSMIPHLINTTPQTKIKLFFGLRHSTDLIYQEFFQNIQSQYPHFTFHYCLSQPDTNWNDLSGHITDHLGLIQNLTNSSFYLCGSPNMIEEAQSKLLQLGVIADKIYFEKYW